jgi:hypothetical protein
MPYNVAILPITSILGFGEHSSIGILAVNPRVPARWSTPRLGDANAT